MNNLRNPDRYPVPDTEYESYDDDILASDIRIGDELPPAGKVAKVTVGHKYMTAFSKSGAQILRVERDKTITVRRRRTTEASREADHRQMRNVTLIKALEGNLKKDLEAALDELTAHVVDYGQADYWRIGKLMTEQAAYKLWVNFETAVDYMDKRDDFDGDLLDVYNDYVDTLKEQLLNRYSHKAISRSSNVLSNLMEDVEHQAIVEFINQNRYW